MIPRLPNAFDYLRGPLLISEPWSVTPYAGEPIQKLTREEVVAKYWPKPDPLWTPEVEAKFFAALDAISTRQSVSMDDEKEMLIREFAKVDLRAGRLRDGYVSALGAILGLFADADSVDGECLISRREDSIGSEKTIRTIQAQMLRSGHLVKEIRTQGHGFVGEVLVYSPLPSYRHRAGTVAHLEMLHRQTEGVCPNLDAPVNLSPEDVPF